MFNNQFKETMIRFLTQVLIREVIKQKHRKRWWLVYGPPRTGTTYITRLISSCSKLFVSDWHLQHILRPLSDRKDIKFDQERFFKDVSNNILDNAHMSKGKRLKTLESIFLRRAQYIDLVFKQQGLSFEEYNTLIRMWGKPERKIFCFREPAGYISSARKKFFQHTLNQDQRIYVRSLDTYEKIGGDIIEYTADLNIEDYILFLKPLELEKNSLEKFKYKGNQTNEDITEEMWSVYQSFKEKNAPKIFNNSKMESNWR